MSQSYSFMSGGLRRTLASRATDSINPRDFGAYGTGTAHPLGTALGVTTLAQLASWTGPVTGVHPYAFVTNPVFGLTFSVPTASAQAAAGSSLSFAITTDNTSQTPNSTAFNYAAQADVVTPGMVASGSCVASGSTVSSVVSAQPFALGTQSDQGGAGTKIPMPYTTGLVVGEGVSGTSVPAGATIVSLTATSVTLSASTTADVTSGALLAFAGGGSVVLSAPTSSACAANTAITFALSNAQVQALDMDWLGLEAAAVAAGASSSGAMHVPQGNWLLSRMFALPTNGSGNVVRLVGDGKYSTVFTATADLGYGACMIGDANSSAGMTNGAGEYTDLNLIGPHYGYTVGTTPSQMDGLCVGANSRVRRVSSRFFRAGVRMTMDHNGIEDSALNNDWFGYEYTGNPNNMGNQFLYNVNMTGEAFASVGIAWNLALDGLDLFNVSTGFGPYGFVHEAAPAGIVPTKGMLTSGHYKMLLGEALGNGEFYGENFQYGGTNGGIADQISGNRFENTSPGLSPPGFGYQLPTRPRTAIVYATAFLNNVMASSDFDGYGDDGIVASSIFDISGAFQGNEFGDNVSSGDLVTETRTPAILAGYVGSSGFRYNNGRGEFKIAEAAVTAGQIVQVGTQLVQDSGSAPATVGGSILGVALQPAAAGAGFAVQTSGFVGTVNVSNANVNHGALVCQSSTVPSAATTCGSGSTSWVVGEAAGYGGIPTSFTTAQIRVAPSPVHP